MACASFVMSLSKGCLFGVPAVVSSRLRLFGIAFPIYFSHIPMFLFRIHNQKGTVVILNTHCNGLVQRKNAQLGAGINVALMPIWHPFESKKCMINLRCHGIYGAYLLICIVVSCEGTMMTKKLYGQVGISIII